MYTTQYFKQKFAAIPANKWVMGYETYDDRCCAYGHCRPADAIIDEDCAGQRSEEGIALRRLFAKLPGGAIIENDPAMINDNENSRFKQPTCKERILAAVDEVEAIETAERIAAGDAILNSFDPPIGAEVKKMAY